MIAQAGQCYLNVMVRWLGLSYHHQVWIFESCSHLWEDIFKLESNFQSPTRFSEQKWTWRFHKISKKSRKGQSLGSSLAWKVKEVQLWHVCFKLLSCDRWELTESLGRWIQRTTQGASAHGFSEDGRGGVGVQGGNLEILKKASRRLSALSILESTSGTRIWGCRCQAGQQESHM